MEANRGSKGKGWTGSQVALKQSVRAQKAVPRVVGRAGLSLLAWVFTH